jgi:hypothetical protein
VTESTPNPEPAKPKKENLLEKIGHGLEKAGEDAIEGAVGGAIIGAEILAKDGGAQGEI